MSSSRITVRFPSFTASAVEEVLHYLRAERPEVGRDSNQGWFDFSTPEDPEDYPGQLRVPERWVKDLLFIPGSGGWYAEVLAVTPQRRVTTAYPQGSGKSV